MIRFRFHWLPALLLVLVALTGCAKGSTAPPTEAGTPPAPASTTAPASAEAAAVLRVNEGDEVTYHTTAKTASSGGINGMPLPQSGAATMEFDTKLHFDKVVGNEVTVSYTISGFTSHTETAAGVFESPSTPDKHYTMKIDRSTGKLLALDLGSELNGAAKDQLMKILDRTFAHFPTGTRFVPGSTWTMDLSQPIPMPMPGLQGESKVTTTTTYEADETRDGVRVARLVTTGSGPVNGQGEADGVTYAAKGTIVMNAVQYLDLKTGLQHSLENHWVFKFTQTMKDTATGESTDAEIESTSDAVMVRK